MGVSKAGGRWGPQGYKHIHIHIYIYTDMYMGHSQYDLHNLLDMGSLLGTRSGAVLNYKKDHYVLGWVPV